MAVSRLWQVLIKVGNKFPRCQSWLADNSPNWQVEVLVGFPLAVDVPVANPHGYFLGVEALDAVGRRHHVSRVYQGAAARVLCVTVHCGQEAHVPVVMIRNTSRSVKLTTDTLRTLCCCPSHVHVPAPEGHLQTEHHIEVCQKPSETFKARVIIY